MIETILARKLASYRDIQEFYGMGDVFDLYELATKIMWVALDYPQLKKSGE